MERLIKLNNISVNYDSSLVLKYKQLTFTTVGFYCIYGSSGVGKTTLLNVIADLISYQGVVEGLDNLKISMIFQEDRLIDTLSVANNLSIVDHGNHDEFIAKRNQLLDVFGLKDVLHHDVDSLSGGMKRRVSIIRALLSEHDILLVDEACKGLDPSLVDTVVSTIYELNKDKLVLWVSHHLDELSNLQNINYINLDKIMDN